MTRSQQPPNPQMSVTFRRGIVPCHKISFFFCFPQILIRNWSRGTRGLRTSAKVVHFRKRIFKLKSHIVLRALQGDDYVPLVWVDWTKDTSGKLEACVALVKEWCFSRSFLFISSSAGRCYGGGVLQFVCRLFIFERFQNFSFVYSA